MNIFMLYIHSLGRGLHGHFFAKCYFNSHSAILPSMPSLVLFIIYMLQNAFSPRAIFAIAKDAWRHVIFSTQFFAKSEIRRRTIL